MGERLYDEPSGRLADCEGRAEELLLASRADGTKHSYKDFWCVFVIFLQEMPAFRGLVGPDLCVALPVPVRAVCAWAGYLSWHYAPSTLDIAMASISVVHEFEVLPSPAPHPRVRKVIEGAKRRWRGGRDDKWVLLPQHVRAVNQLCRVCDGPHCAGKLWSQPRVMRVKAAVTIGYIAFLRKSEVLALDACDLAESRQGTGFDVRVRRAKNDPHGEGRSSVIGNERGDGTGVRPLLDAWRAHVALLKKGECSKRRNAQDHCEACGWLFPRIGGRPACLVRDRTARPKTTTDFLAKDMRQALRQLQVDNHPDVDVTMDVLTFTSICLRRAGNSVAAAAGIANALRQVQGRWNGPEAMDQNYMFVHRAEFEQIGGVLMRSNMGQR